MTTLTVEIGKEEDLSILKEIVSKMGLYYEVDEQDDFIYTDEIKKMLDEREEEYLSGKVLMITAEESEKQIQELLKSKK